MSEEIPTAYIITLEGVHIHSVVGVVLDDAVAVDDDAIPRSHKLSGSGQADAG